MGLCEALVPYQLYVRFSPNLSSHSDSLRIIIWSLRFFLSLLISYGTSMNSNYALFSDHPIRGCLLLLMLILSCYTFGISCLCRQNAFVHWLGNFLQVKNPWPNVDAHSGVLLNYYGLTEARYDRFILLIELTMRMDKKNWFLPWIFSRTDIILSSLAYQELLAFVLRYFPLWLFFSGAFSSLSVY